MVNPTREKLKKKDYNPTKHRHGAWRADLAELRLEVMINLVCLFMITILTA
jgi:hypothetical protein